MDQQIADSVASITSRISELQSSGKWSDIDGTTLHKQLTEIQHKIQTPVVFLQGMVHAPHKLTAARVALAMGIFDAYAQDQTDILTIDQLQARAKGEPALQKRIMRLLATHGMARSVTPESWALTPSGTLIRSGSPPAAMVDHFYDFLRPNSILVEFLEATDFRDPVDTYNGPWQKAYGTSKQYFDWLANDRRRQESFNTLMTINAKFRGQAWFDFFPVQEKLVGSPENALLVDLGGGVGHDLIALKEAKPNLQGTLVLQDLPHVIDSIASDALPAGITAQGYDMFTPQPVRGAKAYYLRTVLHDWPDEQALQVLANVKEAMGPHSLLLLNENLMDEQNLSDTAVCIDFIMMNSFAARERTEKDWRALLDRAGYKLVKVWYPQGLSVGPSALFEAVPA